MLVRSRFRRAVTDHADIYEFDVDGSLTTITSYAVELAEQGARTSVRP